jgi:hypothetical protein
MGTGGGLPKFPRGISGLTDANFRRPAPLSAEQDEALVAACAVKIEGSYRATRNMAFRRAVDAGVSVYQLAQEVDIDETQVRRIVREENAKEPGRSQESEGVRSRS